MIRTNDFTEPQRRVLLELACTPPGRYSQIGCTSTVRSLQRRGLVETHPMRGVRLAHNSYGRACPASYTHNGGAPV